MIQRYTMSCDEGLVWCHPIGCGDDFETRDTGRDWVRWEDVELALREQDLRHERILRCIELSYEGSDDD